MKIADKTYVAIDYSLTIDSGEEIDRSKEGEPLSFITGSGQIIPGLEKELVDKTVGDSFKVSIEPEDAYGPVKEDLLQEIPRDRFPENEDINPGMSFQAEGPNGPFMIIVKSLNDNNTVTIDLNHPLAGQRLHFDLSVAEVREPNAEELAQLAAGAGGCGCGCEPETKGECGSNASSGCGCAG